MGKNIAVCSECGRELTPCPAMWDGEPTYVGFYPCPEHPKAEVKILQLKDKKYALAGEPVANGEG